MARIEGIGIKNYRVLKDITLGKLWNTQTAQPLTPMTAVIGKNGVGKSSLFDAFGFLADCLKLGVEEACDARGRGGFERIRSQGTDASIEFEVYYREDSQARPITYKIAIDDDDFGRPYVAHERLRQRRFGQRHGWPFSFLMMNDGKGVAWRGEAEGRQVSEDDSVMFDLNLLLMELEEEESAETEIVELQDKRKPGIATLGALKQHPRPVFPILGVFRLNGQPKRDGSIIVRSCKATQSPVYPIRDAILAVNHASCPSLSSSGPRQWGESALKTSRFPGALSLLAKSWLYPPSAWRRR